MQYSIIPVIQMLVIWLVNYLDWLGPSGSFAENSTKLIFLEITGYWIKYSIVKCYGRLELQIRHRQNV
jgi:hypothetical protein